MIVFWLITAAAIATVFGMHAYGNLSKIEAEWSTYRCNPQYMLFAGIVDPETGIGGNFRHCMNMIGAAVVGQMTDALGSQFSIIADMLKDISNPLALFRKMITTIRKFILSFATSTLGKASAPVGAFVYYLNKIQDVMHRIVGEGYIATFFGVTAISFIEGFVSLLVGIIKAFVTAMLIISVILALFQPQILAIVLVISASLRAAGI
uniref:Uncharacterized protein n=1 Tax=viral metagenome TaxID=1070528 RepID=A0A6C0B0R3_9ZZZZ